MKRRRTARANRVWLVNDVAAFSNIGATAATVGSERVPFRGIRDPR